MSNDTTTGRRITIAVRGEVDWHSEDPASVRPGDLVALTADTHGIAGLAILVEHRGGMMTVLAGWDENGDAAYLPAPYRYTDGDPYVCVPEDWEAQPMGEHARQQAVENMTRWLTGGGYNGPPDEAADLMRGLVDRWEQAATRQEQIDLLRSLYENGSER